jgi:hypothetical protein
MTDNISSVPKSARDAQTITSDDAKIKPANSAAVKEEAVKDCSRQENQGIAF